MLFTADLKAFENRQSIDKALNGTVNGKKRKVDSQKRSKNIEKISQGFENLEKNSANADNGSINGSNSKTPIESISSDKALRRSRRLRVQ